MISRCIAFLAAALLLANCCGLGTGCAPAANTPLAWDGLGSAATEDDRPVELQPKKPVEVQPKKHARTNREIVAGPAQTAATEPNRKLQPKDDWREQEAVDLADETRLKRKLIICRDCVGGDSARGETVAR
jgi:type IV secretory pathway VirB10-like protein